MTDQDLDIEWAGQGETNSAASISLPQNFITVGTIESDDIKVYIRQDVYIKIEELSKSDTAKELGSILIGDYCEEMGKTHVVISHYIEAKYTDATASTLTFTHESWDYIHGEKNSKYENKKIVGWQHTHPNYGIFLSNYDLFIQENFFNLPFQVAYVVDPIANTRGFFQWKHHQIQKLNGFYIYDEIGRQISVGNPNSKSSEIGNSYTRRPYYHKFSLAALSVLFVCLVCLGYFTYEMNDRYKALQSRQHTASETIAAYGHASNLQEQVITKQQQLIADMNRELKETQASLANLQQSMADKPGPIEVQPVVAPAPDPSAVHFEAYRVQAGDTLSQICMDKDIPYNAYSRIIHAVNGLDDADSIKEGQVLLLPAGVG